MLVSHQYKSTSLKNDNILFRLFKMHLDYLKCIIHLTIIKGIFFKVHLSVFRNSGVTFEDLNTYKKFIKLNS